jgi:hypothetical protein
MTEYQGHRSWNSWNVALYIANEEHLYRLAVDCLKQTRNIEQAVNLFCRVSVLLGDKTPDGAVYNRLCIKEALLGLEIEQDPS